MKECVKADNITQTTQHAIHQSLFNLFIILTLWKINLNIAFLYIIFLYIVIYMLYIYLLYDIRRLISYIEFFNQYNCHYKIKNMLYHSSTNYWRVNACRVKVVTRCRVSWVFLSTRMSMLPIFCICFTHYLFLKNINLFCHFNWYLA